LNALEAYFKGISAMPSAGTLSIALGGYLLHSSKEKEDFVLDIPFTSEEIDVQCLAHLKTREVRTSEV
jgi:hypothetical protein